MLTRLLASLSLATATASPATINITADDGEFVWAFASTPDGYALGSILLGNVSIEAPWTGGLLYFTSSNRSDGTTTRAADAPTREWVYAAEAWQLTASAVRFRGSAALGSCSVGFNVTVSAHSGGTAGGTTLVAFNTSWRVQPENSDCRYSLSVPLFGDDAATSQQWRSFMYPWAGNSTAIDQTPLQYVGVPAALLFRPDWSHAVLHGLDPASDYLNPATWTGATGYSFGDPNATAPAWSFGGGSMSSSVQYSAAVQMLFSAQGSMPGAVNELVSSWRAWNGFTVQALDVMSPEHAFRTFLAGRRSTPMWIDGYGYKLQSPGKDFGSGNYVRMTSQPCSAYLNYLTYVRTGDALWRNRSFVQMALLLRAQNRNTSSVHHGAIHSSFRLDTMAFTSNDRGHSPGLKVDLICHMARYVLQMWRAVLQHEDLNRTDWHAAGVAAAQWVARQQNPEDGGLPNRIVLQPIDNWDDLGTPSASVVSGRALSGLPIIVNMTHDDPHVLKLVDGLENFLAHRAEDSLRFTGQHPDLHGGDFEPNSIWGAVEFRLGRGELERALADANLAFLMLCPKQLSWVRNPTQLAFTEQQNYLQYSEYVYDTKKVAVLHKLSAATGDLLWAQMADRLTQMSFFAMNVTNGGGTKGGIYEAIADPWLARHGGLERLGGLYMDSYNIDLFLQLLEEGLL